ncbi:hypothetical protein [Natronoglycomyces albus]|uniref:Uncharacterized protein n=1 Tax=Natronoglycomyces albus TaxID=2811108 RepID=A0A895XV73_9ACTN|nr:hypothetical protein [Natronoglycomyces albus]QSB07159.1 hypothetical protein JQS30_17100 [Natronoglycomyces albus]
MTYEKFHREFTNTNVKPFDVSTNTVYDYVGSHLCRINGEIKTVSAPDYWCRYCENEIHLTTHSHLCEVAEGEVTGLDNLKPINWVDHRCPTCGIEHEGPDNPKMCTQCRECPTN